MSDYHSDKSVKYIEMTRAILQELPDFFSNYFRAIAPYTEPLTRYNYAVDLRTFITFLCKTNNLQTEDITSDIFGNIGQTDIEEYLEYLTGYEKGTNSENGLARKLSSLRSIYKYYAEHPEYPNITYNPAMLVRMPKIHKKDIIFMTTDEIVEFLNLVRDYEKSLVASKHKLAYYKKTKYRDIAMMTLMLGTGIRVSECAGLNIDNVNFRENSILVKRKGGKVQNVYFTDEVAQVLKDYLEIERKHLVKEAEDTTPLFYSMQKKRMSVKSIERVVEKYAKEVIPSKHITAHKLRASYATELYENSSDIYLTADALGHSSITTTTRYANLSQKRRQSAPDFIKHNTSSDIS